MTRNRRRGLLIAGVLTAIVGVGACSHSIGSAGSSNAEGAGGRTTTDGAAGTQTLPDAEGPGAKNPAVVPTRPAAAPAADSPERGAADDAGAQPSTVSLRLPGDSVIRTAQMQVAITHARDVSGRADRAGVIAEAVGGEIDSDNRTSGKHAQADLVLRVPPDKLSSVLTRLARLGRERSRELTSTDVTQKVADVGSRVTSARQAISRLRALYATATKVADVLAVEDELSTREADLEALEAQQRALANQTSLATVTLSLRTASKVAVPARHSADRGGFLGGLGRGWHAFTAAASALAKGVGAAVPFAVLVLLLGLAGRIAWNRRRAAVRTPSPAPPA